MVDYIRGKKTYTKWDADSENVDIEYNDDPKLPFLSGCLSGPKGIIIKTLLILIVLCVGLVIGYSIHHSTTHGNVPLQIVMGDIPVDFVYKPESTNFLRQEIKPESIKNHLRHLSGKSHVAGTQASQDMSSVIKTHWFQNDLEDVRIESYDVLLSYPSPNGSSSVTIVNNDTNVTVSVLTNVSASDKPYLAYSGRGPAMGKLVYANYGRMEDFKTLDKLNVSVHGAIVIMRLGKSHRGDKVRWAEEKGAFGALLYPDPAEYVGNLPLYPDGLGLPGDAVVFGSLKTYPGDPETPRLPSIDAAYRQPFGVDLGLRTIPAMPISYNDALKLLSNLSGPSPPSDWFGGLNVSYQVGPGFQPSIESHYVRLQVSTELQRRKIFNVLGVLYGKYERDDYVIVGCHHDAWANGASDPGSGLAVMFELVHAFGKLRKTGWTPGRSIVFASWDAEEFGIIGSTEWVEDHAKELIDNAVAYINLDSAVTGNNRLHALGSPLLKQVVFEAAREVAQQNVNGESKSFDLWQGGSPIDVTNAFSYPSLEILGSGSDFVSFMSGYGIPSVHVQFIDKDLDTDYPLYHTYYDVFDMVANYTDPTFNGSSMLAQLIATMTLKLSDSLLLPFSCHDYVTALQQGLLTLRDAYDAYLAQHGISLNILQEAIAHFDRAANILYTQFDNTTNQLLTHHDYNHQLMQIERSFILPRGVQNSPVFRHAIFGPHPQNLHEGVIYPGVIDAILRAQHNSTILSVEAIAEEIAEVVQVLRAAGNMLINAVITRHDTSKPFL